MRMIPKELQRQLKNIKPAKNSMTGSCWYNILANYDYVREFAYISTNMKNRTQMIVDGDDNEENDCEQSDMVNIILNLALVDDSFVEKIKFETGISK